LKYKKFKNSINEKTIQHLNKIIIKIIMTKLINYNSTKFFIISYLIKIIFNQTYFILNYLLIIHVDFVY